MIEWTNGWKVINFKLNDDQHHGFIKVTKLKYIVIECNKWPSIIVMKVHWYKVFMNFF